MMYDVEMYTVKIVNRPCIPVTTIGDALFYLIRCFLEQAFTPNVFVNLYLCNNLSVPYNRDLDGKFYNIPIKFKRTLTDSLINAWLDTEKLYTTLFN